jgi:hypothetical protein
LGARLFELLDTAAHDGRESTTTLYELDDEQLESALEKFGKMRTSRWALGHNKFLVICDENNKPRWTWTGSQNRTETGLCTEANNSVLIDDPRGGGHPASRCRSPRQSIKSTSPRPSLPSTKPTERSCF